MIARNIKLEVRLIDDLLDLTKLSKNKLILNEKPVDIHDELKHTITLVEHDTVSKDLNLISILQAHNSYVNGDPA